MGVPWIVIGEFRRKWPRQISVEWLEASMALGLEQCHQLYGRAAGPVG